MTRDPALVLLSVVAQNVVLFVLTVGLFWLGVFVARRLTGSKMGYGLGALGLSRPKPGYFVGAGLGFLVGVGALVASLVLNPVSVFVFERLGYSTESTVQQPFMRGLQSWVAESPGVAIPAIFAVVVLLGPAVEELVFRGAIFGGLARLFASLSGKTTLRSDGESKRRGGVLSFTLAAILSSVVFALLHFEPVILPALFGLAIALCALYRKTGSLVSPFVAHATFNSFAVLAIVLGGLGALPTQV